MWLRCSEWNLSIYIFIMMCGHLIKSLSTRTSIVINPARYVCAHAYPSLEKGAQWELCNK
jgi:hypothetical protein